MTARRCTKDFSWFNGLSTAHLAVISNTDPTHTKTFLCVCMRWLPSKCMKLSGSNVIRDEIFKRKYFRLWSETWRDAYLEHFNASEHYKHKACSKSRLLSKIHILCQIKMQHCNYSSQLRQSWRMHCDFHDGIKVPKTSTYNMLFFYNPFKITTKCLLILPCTYL